MIPPESKELEQDEQLRLHLAVRITEAQITEADRIANERLVLGFTGPGSEDYSKIVLQVLSSNYLAATLLHAQRLTASRDLRRSQRANSDQSTISARLRVVPVR